jgi:hypothetical protein
MKRKRLDTMAAFAKLLVLIAIFLLASNANAFTSLSPVAGNQVQENNDKKSEPKLLLSHQPVQIDEEIIQRSPNATDASFQQASPSLQCASACKQASYSIQYANTINQ